MREKIGSGRRFRGLSSTLASKGAKNPNALAAYIGRKKYGKARFQALAQAGKRRAENEEPSPEEVARQRSRRVKV